MPDLFRSYLESVCATYARWWQLYTLTDAAGKAQQAKQTAPTFDFGLMVQAIAPQKSGMERDDSGDRSEKIERFEVLEGIRKYADRHVLLVGRPGSGKSTALARLMLEEATTQTSEVSKTSEVSAWVRIPILVELRYWQGSMNQLILNALARHGLSLTTEQLELVLGQALILFDGVNELPSEEARSQLFAFRRDHPQVPMIFTTRDLGLGGDLGIEQKLEMQPLTEAQMQAFVRAYVPEQAEALLRQLKDRLRELGQTPLLLWMLCGLFQQTGTIPENLGLVFRLFTQGYERNLKQDVVVESDRAWWQPVLQQLAWVMMQGQTPTELRVAIGRGEAMGAIAQFLTGKVPYAEDFARKCLRDLQKHHLIQAGTNPDELEFRHQLLQEYYAAEALLERLPGLSDAELQREYLNYLKWTEPMALMLALVGDDKSAVRVVKQALDVVDWMLGARLAGEVKSKLQGQTVGLVGDWKVPNWLKIELLGRTKSKVAVAEISKIFRPDVDENICWTAIKALNKIHAEDSISELLKIVLVCPFESYRQSAAEVLIETGASSAILGLARLLEYQEIINSNPIFKAIAKALRNIDRNIPCNAVSSDLLSQLSQHSNVFVRSFVVMLLGRIDSEIVVPYLIKLLHDEAFGIRREAIQALGGIATSKALPNLLISLQDTNMEVRKSAISALREIRDNKAIPHLIECLSDSEEEVRDRAIWALSELDCQDHIPQLTSLLKSSDPWIRRGAVVGLGQSKSEKAIDPLLRSLQDLDEEVPDSSRDSLIKIGSQKAIPDLLRLLKCQDAYVRRLSIHILGNLGNQGVLVELLEALRDSDAEVRRNSSEAIGSIAIRENIKLSPDFLNQLDKFLKKEEDEYVRDSMVELLEHLSNEGSIDLIDYILRRESSSIVLCTAVRVLAKIGNEESINLLKRRGLRNRFYKVSLMAAQELINLGLTQDLDVINHLLYLVDDPDYLWVREEAAKLLANLKVEKVVPALLRVLDNPIEEEDEVCQYFLNQNKIWCAAEELAKIGNEQSISGLLRALNHPNKEVRLKVVIALRNLKSDRVFEGLFQVLKEDEDKHIRTKAAEGLEELAECSKPGILTDLVGVLPTESGREFLDLILAVQGNCKFYNYEIFRSPPAPPQPTQQDTLAKIKQTVDTIAKTMSDQPTISITGGTFNAPVNLAPNQGHQPTTIIGTQHNYFGADDTLLQQITDLQQFITDLETQHPHIQTLPEAEAARDQAITHIQATNPTRWHTIRQQMRLLKRQLLNPDRHAQAAKATLIEITKAAWEKSLIAKAIITYIDKLSETPEQGA